MNNLKEFTEQHDQTTFTMKLADKAAGQGQLARGTLTKDKCRQSAVQPHSDLATA